jgi:hypothetical protein
MKNIAEQWQQQGNLVDRLNAIRMSESDRQLALASLRNAERICELFERIAGICGTIRISLMTPLRRWLSASRRPDRSGPVRHRFRIPA